MKHLATTVLATLLVVPATLAAQTTAPAAPATAAVPTVGATVYDTGGAPAGTVASVAAGVVTIDTGAHKVPVPAASVGPTAKGLAIAMTKAQLDAAYEKASADAMAQMRARLVPGTAVSSLHGAATVGTIKSADDRFVTLTTAKGEVKLPVSGFSTDAQGKVIVGLTAEQFDAAVSGAGGTGTTQPPASR